ncbi:MAG: D-glycerate dehydrogenase [Chloroflexi bacterium RBG_16_54_18]|nr:MAG: D-glycerate dehydrogenase [Chloroflexi bacterium RBG_16_54_18]
MLKPKVFVTRIIPEKGSRLVEDFCQADIWQDELPPSHAEILKRVGGVDGLLCLLTDQVDAEVMDAAGNGLRVISNHAVGFDNIDVPEATRRGIPVGNTPGILTESTADFAFSLIGAAARRVVEGDRFVHSMKWKTWGPSLLLGTDLHHATLGIVGYGRIGRALARRAVGFDMRVIYYDPESTSDIQQQNVPAEAVDLDTLLRESDFISIHTPLNNETRHMFNRGAFARMKSNAVLVNTARGPVVEPAALYEALKYGQIAYAALDVTEPEPIPVDSPLLELENLVITPHIASASRLTREKMASMAAENLIAGLKGERLPYCVNPEIYPV